MPQVTTPDGLVVFVPGVYTSETVINDLPGPLPAFHIPVVLGGADEGVPYNADSLKFVNESAIDPFIRLNTKAAVQSQFGPKSDLAIATGFAKRHGLPFAFYIALSALTRATVIAQSAGAISQMTLFAKKFGAPGGHIKLKVAAPSNTITITPLKHFTLLTANALGTDTRIFVKDITWVRDGQSIDLGDNATTNVTRTVSTTGEELDAAGQKRFFIELTSTLGSALTTANFAMGVEYDDVNAEVSTALTTGQAVFDFLNDTSKLIGAKKEGTFNDALLITVTEAPLKEVTGWAAPVAGTSPAPTSGDTTAFITQLDAADFDNFLLNNLLIPQAFLVVDGSSTVHLAWRDWAATKRAEGFPVSITTGTEWGDTDLNAVDDTNPLVRTAALNSQDVALCAGGMDFQDPFLSFAPAVFGRRVEGGPNHNLTSDVLQYSSLEIRWDERNLGELTDLHKGGVLTQRLQIAPGIRYVISQGLNTLQTNAQSWNTVTNDTPLIMQRDLADFVQRVLKEGLEGEQLGADRVSRDSIAAVLVRRAQLGLEKPGFIKPNGFTINSIVLNAAGNGFDVQHSVRLPDTNDFLTTETQILVQAEAA